MEVDQDVEVHSVVTEDLQEYTVHGGLKITNEHMHKKFVPYKTVAEGGHGTEVRYTCLDCYFTLNSKLRPNPSLSFHLWALRQWAFHFAESGNWEETSVPVYGDGTETPPLASSHESVLGVCRTRHH